MTETQNQFLVGQKVVYPSQGVGTVTEIFEGDFKGEKVNFYKIYLPVSEMSVVIPVVNASVVGIRAIVSQEEAQKALDSIGEDFAPPTSDWKLRYQMNLVLLKKGTISDIASIVRCLYHRSKIKELPILERKLYDNAKKLLQDEVAEAFGISEKEVEAILHAKLEPLALKVEKKSSYAQDDEEDFDQDAEESKDESESRVESEVDG